MNQTGKSRYNGQRFVSKLDSQVKADLDRIAGQLEAATGVRMLPSTLLNRALANGAMAAVEKYAEKIASVVNAR